MQNVKPRYQLSIRPLFVLVSLTGFLLVYVTGVLRDQPLLWVTISSTVTLILLLLAGLAIESLLDHGSRPNEEPAVTYEPSTRPPDRTDERQLV
ncbi:hypothetical protein OO015_10680 [Thermomicrobium sp. 4228-Ro]|uniref:hypothetical protein n=1 Tax=Thermomicrobium sp. 4228-Ro TaxID=2993937 RepID=UPI0022491587|nr:hypothetical protein [Thermomicrobium sp. 4228-Ro]MCX2727954.1 hypothetical protein [Thermomicrobium sp. 4228-Ro]